MTHSTPLELYQKQIKDGELLYDPRQEQIVKKFQNIYQNLLSQKPPTLIKKLTTIFNNKPVVKGLYLWGSVGSGKTFLMDLFYNSLPINNKTRIHFHKFMQQVHLELKKHQGISDPLRVIAKQISKQTKVFCFDELVVTDIADAMLLAGLFKALIEARVYLFFTSNSHPDDLYKNGLQRQRFLPAIELIKENTEIVHLQTAVDYRSHALDNEKLYWYPLDEVTHANMEHHFEKFSKNVPVNHEPLLVFERKIPIKKSANGAVWFDFMAICGIPRSQNDYLFIAEHFHTVFISDLMPIKEQQRDLALSFIKLVDVFYDSKTRLIIAASVPIDQLYDKGPLSFEFARTRSRLTQMQSVNWLFSPSF